MKERNGDVLLLDSIGDGRVIRHDLLHEKAVDSGLQGNVMPGEKSRRKHKGHYCWTCDSFRSNESFSGKGHALHLCKECSRLPADELTYRQALRDLERCITWEGIIPRKRRRSFLMFLEHADPRIRQLALEMQEEDRIARRQPWQDSDDDSFGDDTGGNDHNFEVMEEIVDGDNLENDQVPF